MEYYGILMNSLRRATQTKKPGQRTSDDTVCRLTLILPAALSNREPREP